MILSQGCLENRSEGTPRLLVEIRRIRYAYMEGLAWEKKLFHCPIT